MGIGDLSSATGRASSRRSGAMCSRTVAFFMPRTVRVARDTRVRPERPRHDGFSAPRVARTRRTEAPHGARRARAVDLTKPARVGRCVRDTSKRGPDERSGSAAVALSQVPSTACDRSGIQVNAGVRGGVFPRIFRARRSAFSGINEVACPCRVATYGVALIYFLGLRPIMKVPPLACTRPARPTIFRAPPLA
jgi:hypothetical protein